MGIIPAVPGGTLKGITYVKAPEGDTAPLPGTDISGAGWAANARAAGIDRHSTAALAASEVRANRRHASRPKYCVRDCARVARSNMRRPKADLDFGSLADSSHHENLPIAVYAGTKEA
ncbi:MAG TPA: hypothetical protein VMH86_08435 [Rhizomicrobium sp.]|nr:hypothetical protein [Rhizomicrobium sp.]